MRILVIGGTLFIGKLLVQRLQESGHEVMILHRTPSGSAEELIADRNDPAAVRQALAGHRFDAVFDNVYDWQRGTTAEQVLATAQAVGDVQRYVFMSSVAAYGTGLNRREHDPLAPADDPDPYVRNKANSERALFAFYAQTGFPVVTLRPPFIYGPGNPYYREAFFWDRLRHGRPILIPDDGQRLMQFVYVKDLVEACLLVLRHPVAGQAFNIAGPAPVTQQQLVEELALAAGIPPDIRFVPRERALAAGGHPMGPKLYFAMYYDLPPITEDTTLARDVLGWHSTGFAHGLRDTYAAYTPTPHPDFSFDDLLL